MPLTAGTKFGHYEILSLLGAGGMGEVFRAHDPRLGRDVAIKIIPEEFAGSKDRLFRFEQEARSSSSLNHPNIITIYEIGSHDSTAYIAMEYVEGKTLRDLLSSGPVPMRKLLNIATQMADGLARAHAAGIVHRDLKPENVMVSKDGYCKILDFGLAKLLTPSSSGGATHHSAQTRSGALVGTTGYMSPEQAGGEALDYRSDQFSFGIILYEMITGKHPFQRAGMVETLYAITKEEAESLSTLNPRIPVPMQWIVERCLAKDPQDRYASTLDLARDLQNIRNRFSAMGSSSAEQAIGVSPPARARRFPLALIGVVAGILVGLGIGMLLHRPAPIILPTIHYLTYSGHDYSPAASPDGRIIAFTSDRDGRPRIWLKELSVGGEVALTSGPDDHARFSPDGSTIIFSRTEGTQISLYRSSVLGGDQRKVMEDADFGDFSPDGKQIVYVRSNTNAQGTTSLVFASNADGSSERQIAQAPNLLLAPRWSPDGHWIAAMQGGAAIRFRSIMLISADGKEQKILHPSTERGNLSYPAWSAHGLVYSQMESAAAGTGTNSGSMVLQDIKSGKTQSLFWSLNLFLGPQNSQGGVVDILAPGKIIFDASLSRQNLRQISLGTGGEMRWLTRGNSNDRQPCYSPDGEWVAFSTYRTGNLDLWKVSTKTAALSRLTDDSSEDWDPAFTPDGKHILWSSNRTGHFEIWIANADGSSARQLSHDGADAENPTATPDGWVIYNSYEPEKAGIWKIRMDGSQAKRLVAGLTNVPEVSPDGRFVVYSNTIAQTPTPTPRWVRFVRLDNGAVLPFEIPIQSNPNSGRARWMKDGKALAYIDFNEAGISGIYVQDFDPAKDTSASRHPLAGFDPDVTTESFGFSPDGSSMTLSGFEILNSLMLAENVPIKK